MVFAIDKTKSIFYINGINEKQLTMEIKMKIKQLFDNMYKYNENSVGDIFPMDMSCFYNDIWNDWRNDNQIPMNDAISLWDYMMKTDYINNDDCDDLEMKQTIEQIRLFKMECDF